MAPPEPSAISAAAEVDVPAVVAAGLASLDGLSIAFFDHDLTLLAVHGGAALRHGYRPDLMLGRRAPDVLPATLWDAVGDLYDRALAGETVTIERPSHDGTAFYETTFQPVREGDRVTGGMVISRDITAQRRTEDRLRASERDFRQMAESSPNVVYRATLDGEPIYVSPASRRVLGLEPEAVTFRAGAGLHPDDRERVAASRAAVIADGEPRAVDARYRRPDGTEIWIAVMHRVPRDPDTGAVHEVHGVIRDITREKANERLLLEQHAQQASEARAVARFERTFDEAPVGMMLVRRGRVERANETMAQMLGLPAAELIGTDPLRFHDPREPTAATETWASILAEDERTPHDRRVLAADGAVRSLRLRYSVLLEDGADPVVLVHAVDRTAEVEAAEQREAALALFETSFAQAPIGMALVGLDGRFLRVNEALCTLFDRPADELLAADFQGLTHADDLAADLDLLQATLDGERDGYELDKRYLRPDGSVVTARLSVSLVRDAVGVPAHFISQIVDLSALRAADALFQSAFDNTPVGVVVSRHLAGDRTEVVRVNHGLAAMLGYDSEELVGEIGPRLLHPSDVATRGRMITDVLAGRPAGGELRFLHRDGHEVWAHVVLSTVTSADGEQLVLTNVLDISERKRFEDQLRHLADHDGLTGLYSRRRFEEELGRESARVRRDGRPGCLLLLDLDGFKHVNDSFGHSAGDALLTRISGALTHGLRDIDLLARIGGDEFAVILPNTDLAGGRVVADKLLEAVRAHGRVVHGRHQAEVTASIGLTTLTAATIAADGSPLDGEALLVEADIAMYQAKDGGKDGVSVYDRADGRRAQITRHASWVGRLRDAIRDERFVLFTQPIVPLQPGPDARKSHELLLRLQQDDGRLIPPSAFLYHAERHGLVVDIDRWVLRQAVVRLHAEQAAGRPLSLAVNFSARTVQDPAVVDDLARMLEAYPIAPGSLMIEVTETAAITNITRAAELARQLRTLGCRLALDDFGAGFASFYYLKHLVFDVLKIDGDFIERLPSSATDQLVVRAVVDIARGLGAELIAERVSDQATVDLLASLGVDHGQGFFLGRPRRMDQ